MDDVDKKLEALDDIRNSLKAITERVDGLESSVSNNTQQLEQVNKYLRRNNLEIHGVPEKNGEDLYELLSKIGSALGIQIEKSDIDIVHRLKAPTTSSRPRIILVKFVNRWLKNDLVNVRRQRHKESQELTTTELGFQAGEESVIFFNDHLTKEAKYLLYLAKRHLRGLTHQFVWTKSGSVFVKKDAASKPIELVSPDQVDKLKAALPSASANFTN